MEGLGREGVCELGPFPSKLCPTYRHQYGSTGYPMYLAGSVTEEKQRVRGLGNEMRKLWNM